MTEPDWLNSTDPQVMLAFLHSTGSLSERKARLFGVACCRRVWPLLTDERSRLAVEAAESSADSCSSPAELEAAYYAANVALLGTDSLDECYYSAAGLACSIAYQAARYGCYS